MFKTRLRRVLGLRSAWLPVLIGASLAFPVLAATPASAINVGSVNSTALAGYSLDGNGSTVFDGEWRQVIVPAEPGSVSPDTVVAGIIMAQNVSTGDFAVGEGLVLDDDVQAHSCGLGWWTLEAGTGNVVLGAQPVLPASVLRPLLHFGAPVCISAGTGGSEFLYLYHSHKYHLVRESAGTNSHNWNVLGTAFPPGNVYTLRTAGAGVMTCDLGTTTCMGGTNAANQLQIGNNFGKAGVGFYVNGQGNSVFGQGVNMYRLNYVNWEGTQSGGPPTVSNPSTLTTNPLNTLAGPYGEFSVNVP